MAGRPKDPMTELRESILIQHGIAITHRNIYMLTVRFMDQLANCKDDSARRLLLGVSR